MYYFIVNKTSGSGRSLSVWKEVETELLKRQIEYEAYFTEHEGHATELAEAICKKVDEHIYLVTVGGDGTVNEVINGLTNFEHLYFGYIPTGSGNDFARGMGIKGTPTENLLRIIREHKIVSLDLGEVSWKGEKSPRRFAISSGIGIDAFVCKQALTSNLKKFLNKIKLGSLTYLCLTVKSLFTMPDTTVEISFDGKAPRTVDRMIFIVGMNQYCEGGGVPMAPKATATDGKLSICLVHGISRWRAFFLLPVLVMGRHAHIKGFEIIDCHSFELKIHDPMVLHADGEYCGDVRRASFRCLSGKLKMIL